MLKIYVTVTKKWSVPVEQNWLYKLHGYNYVHR